MGSMGPTNARTRGYRGIGIVYKYLSQYKKYKIFGLSKRGTANMQCLQCFVLLLQLYCNKNIKYQRLTYNTYRAVITLAETDAIEDGTKGVEMAGAVDRTLFTRATFLRMHPRLCAARAFKLFPQKLLQRSHFSPGFWIGIEYFVQRNLSKAGNRNSSICESIFSDFL